MKDISSASPHQGEFLWVGLRRVESQRARPVLGGIFLAVGSFGKELLAQPRIFFSILMSIAERNKIAFPREMNPQNVVCIAINEKPSDQQPQQLREAT